MRSNKHLKSFMKTSVWEILKGALSIFTVWLLLKALVSVLDGYYLNIVAMPLVIFVYFSIMFIIELLEGRLG